MKKLTLLLLPLIGLALTSCEWGRANPKPPVIDPPIDPSENAFEFNTNSSLLDAVNAVVDKNNVTQEELISILNNLDANDDVINHVSYSGLDANYNVFDQPVDENIFEKNMSYTLARYQNEDNTTLLVDGISEEDGYYYDENLAITNYDYTYNRQINRDLVNSRYYDFYDDANKSSFTGSYVDSYAYLDYVYREAITIANSSDIKYDAITYILAAEVESYPITIVSNGNAETLSIRVTIDQQTLNANMTNFKYSFSVTITNGAITSLSQEEKTYYLDGEEEVIKRIEQDNFIYAINSNQNVFNGALMDVADFSTVNEK